MEYNELYLEAQDLNQQGALLLKTGNYEAAKAKFEKAIELEPMLMISYKNLGDLHMAEEDYTSAKAMYKKALLIEKKGELYFLYGNACFMNDEIHEGLEYYNLAISSGFDNDEMMFFMGMAYEHLNDDSMALRYFQKACIKNPSRPDYIVKKIGASVRLGMIDSAEESIEELLLTAPELFDGYHLKTKLLQHKGEHEKAEIWAESAINRFPEDSELMLDYVRAVALNEKFAKALTLIGQAKKMKYFEDSKQAFTILEAEVAAENHQYEYAKQCCIECISFNNDTFQAYEARFILMNLLITDEKYADAQKVAEEIIAGYKKDSYYFAALYYKPYCMKHVGNVEEAKKYFKEANQIYRTETLINPDAIDLYLYRVMTLKDLEEFEKALDLLEFIENLELEIAEVYTLRAEIFDMQGSKTKVEEELKKAYRIKPELKPESKGE